MASLGGYLLALLGTAVLGSLLNILYWFIEVQFRPDPGFNLGGDFFTVAFFISAFLSFFAALPAFLITWYLEQIRRIKRRFLLHMIVYVIYLIIAVLFFGMHDWEFLIGAHLYLISGIFCSYMFIWRLELHKDTDILDR